MIIFLLTTAVLTLLIFLFMQQASFGKAPSGERLQRIKKSAQYKEGTFQNRSFTPTFTGGGNFFTVMRGFLFGKHPDKKPTHALPAIKRSLLLPVGTLPVITWFGHSSYLLQINGLNILVDPVFSGRTSPVSYAGSQAFAGTDIYKAADMPAIDVLLVTHDHYDHLDYDTVKKLVHKTAVIVTSLGVGAHLQHWGIAADKIKELDWGETFSVNAGTSFTAAPARHFSGRKFTRNTTLWSSFIVQAKSYKIYLGGDSGYDAHFAAIGNQYGPFDLAILENGQYNAYWANIHMMPEETVQAAVDLKANVLLPVHWGKFALATHPWNEPVQRLLAKANELQVKVATPKIGEAMVLDSVLPAAHWWLEGIEGNG